MKTETSTHSAKAPACLRPQKTEDEQALAAAMPHNVKLETGRETAFSLPQSGASEEPSRGHRQPLDPLGTFFQDNPSGYRRPVQLTSGLPVVAAVAEITQERPNADAKDTEVAQEKIAKARSGG